MEIAISECCTPFVFAILPTGGEGVLKVSLNPSAVRGISHDEQEPLENRVVRELELAGNNGVSLRDLQRKFFRKRSAREASDLMDKVVSERGLKKETVPHKQGRPTIKYYSAAQNSETEEQTNEGDKGRLF